MLPRRLKQAVKPFAFTLLACAFSVSAAHSCTRSGLPANAAQAVPTQNLNQSLFNAAVLSEVNFERCKAGVGPLQIAGGLMGVASTHASWMAKRSTLSHRSTVRGQTSVQERVLASGVNARRGSENIGNLPRFQFAGSRRIHVKSISNCDFTTAGGRKIQPHSYATLANQIVGMWMDSAGHRKNVLDSKVSAIGSAVEFDPQATHCGQFFLSQNFAG